MLHVHEELLEKTFMWFCFKTTQTPTPQRNVCVCVCLGQLLANLMGPFFSRLTVSLSWENHICYLLIRTQARFPFSQDFNKTSCLSLGREKHLVFRDDDMNYLRIKYNWTHEETLQIICLLSILKIGAEIWISAGFLMAFHHNKLTVSGFCTSDWKRGLLQCYHSVWDITIAILIDCNRQSVC